MSEAKNYVRYADYPFLQTKSSILYAELLEDYAQQEVFKMICSSEIWSKTGSYANGWKIPTSFSELGVPSSALNTQFAAFKKSYNEQGGTAVQNEHNSALATAKKAN